MAQDCVSGICDDLGVCPEEALFYLEGFKWDFDAAMEACRNKTLPSFNDASSPLKPSAIEACRNETLPSFNDASSPLKPSAMEACRNETLPSINVASSHLKQPTTTESTRDFNQPPEKQPFNLKTQLLQAVETQSSPSRWSIYAKTCHKMILFLTAAALAYLPIRFAIDEHKKCGTILGVEDYLEVVISFLEDFIYKVDPFILCALAYAGFYILSSGSFSPLTVRIAEAISIIFGFGMVFVVIYYISHVTFYVGLALFGFLVVATTTYEFCRA